MKTINRLVVSALAAILLTPLAMAEVYLTIKGGDFVGTASVDGIPGAITVHSVEEGVQSSTTVGAGTSRGSSGRAESAGVRITKPVDANSAAFRKALVTGKALDEVVVYFGSAGQRKWQTFYQFDMKKVVVSSITVRLEGSEAVEDIFLQYAAFEMTVTPVNKTGGTDKPVTAKWDFTTNTP